MGWRQVVALLAACGELAAAEVHLRWNEVRPAVTGKKVTVFTRDGQRVQGKVVDAGAQGLTLKNGASRTVLPADAVSTIQVAPLGGLLRGVLVGVGAGVAGAVIMTVIFAAQAGQGSSKLSDAEVKTVLGIAGALGVTAGVAAGIAQGRKQARKGHVFINVIP
jgi:hypothetical protein